MVRAHIGGSGSEKVCLDSPYRGLTNAGRAWLPWTLCCEMAFGCDACRYFNTIAILCPFPVINYIDL